MIKKIKCDMIFNQYERRAMIRAQNSVYSKILNLEVAKLKLQMEIYSSIISILKQIKKV